MSSAPVVESERDVGVRQAADLYISRGQLAIPNQHDSDDVQGGLIQPPAQNAH